MRTPNRRPEPGSTSPELIAVLVLLVLVVLVVGAVWAAAALTGPVGGGPGPGEPGDLPAQARLRAGPVARGRHRGPSRSRRDRGHRPRRDRVGGAPTTTRPQPRPHRPPTPLYGNVADWLHDYLLPNYRRRQLHARWCRRWWEHAEAISRLEAIWQAWEATRYDGARPGWQCGGATTPTHTCGSSPTPTDRSSTATPHRTSTRSPRCCPSRNHPLACSAPPTTRRNRTAAR